jgi:histidine ammonia-lyase
VKKISLDGKTLTIETLSALARGLGDPVVPAAAWTRLKRSRAFLEARMKAGERLYGVTTGFGHLASVDIGRDEQSALQENLVLSHAAGLGPPYSLEETRAILAARVNVLAKGRSAVRPEVVRLMLACIERNALPRIPEKGSVGASGDLAPLAHAAAFLMGRGRGFWRGREMPAALVLKKAALKPLKLAPKDGIALINGTQVMTAVGALALDRAWKTARHADLALAMSLDALKGSAAPFDARLHEARPHRGQRESAANLRRLLRGRDAIMASHGDCGRVQDCYSLRCGPQVHGAARDALHEASRAVEIELNAVTDNPTVFYEDGAVVPGGNFHGQPVSQALDYAAVGLTAFANVSERRVERLTNDRLSGLPAFLAAKPGLHSGFMMAQVAAAALASENKVLAHPASADSIPTSAAQEDHVSMGVTAARKLREVERNARYVVGIELMCAAQALEFHRPLRPASALERALRAIRRRVKPLRSDRMLSPDMEKMAELIESGDLLAAAGGIF